MDTIASRKSASFSPWASSYGDTLVEDHSYDTGIFDQKSREIPFFGMVLAEESYATAQR